MIPIEMVAMKAGKIINIPVEVDAKKGPGTDQLFCVFKIETAEFHLNVNEKTLNNKGLMNSLALHVAHRLKGYDK